MELEFLRWLRERVPSDPRAALGLSDDAALVSFAERPDVVITTDMLTDGVDFQLGTHEPHRIGRQALGANLSDLAAMAARPLAATISLALPRSGTNAIAPLPLAIALYEGLLPLAQEFGVAIIGGDTNTFDGPLVLSVMALGEPTGRGPLIRSGGRAGDWLLVTGELGGSILGHMLDFTPRVSEAIVLNERYDLNAGIDISDGLALDAARLAETSGCGAVIFADRVPVAGAAFQLAEQEDARDRSATALQHAFSDGQDFELLIAAPPEIAMNILRDRPVACGIAHIGELTPEPGLWRQDVSGSRQPMEPSGWLH
jgi:thiamine-monophosphate kinase